MHSTAWHPAMLQHAWHPGDKHACTLPWPPVQHNIRHCRYCLPFPPPGLHAQACFVTSSATLQRNCMMRATRSACTPARTQVGVLLRSAALRTRTSVW